MVPEITAALRAANFSCAIHFLVSKNQHGEIGPFHGGSSRSTPVSIQQFFTEISILLQASIFIGTFNSNVGRMVALLRSCSRPPHTPHYAHSYAVDKGEQKTKNNINITTREWFLF